MSTLMFATTLACALVSELAIPLWTPQRDQPCETPRERFERKGGRSQPVQVVEDEAGVLSFDHIAQGRDLAQYDRLGPLEGPIMVDLADAERAEAAARAFVWEHWQARRRGYLVITFTSVDARSTSHVFVEPDGNGRWRVAWRIVRHSGSVDDMPMMYSLRRFRLLDDGDAGHEIPADAQVPPAQYVLILYEEDGEEGKSL